MLHLSEDTRTHTARTIQCELMFLLVGIGGGSDRIVKEASLYISPTPAKKKTIKQKSAQQNRNGK